MKHLRAFFKLIRWPNLVFIALTQILFYFCVFHTIYETPYDSSFWYLLTASVLIAAAGYIINDYFDLNIDQVNKPGKNVFSGTISRRWAIIWHWLLSSLGLIATFLAVGRSHWYLVLANAFCIMLLWFYSTSLKRRILVGNIAISLLTSWTVLIIFFAYTNPDDAIAGNEASIKFFRIAFLYSGFAFVISLIREAVKDMEDLEGDLKYGCRTLPIVAGNRATKLYAGILLVMLTLSLVVLQLYIIQFGWWWAVVYLFLFVIVPLVYNGLLLRRASSTVHYAKLSQNTKWIMLTGIISMIFFQIYIRHEPYRPGIKITPPQSVTSVG